MWLYWSRRWLSLDRRLDSQQARRVHSNRDLDVWYGMVEVCEGAPVAVSGWVLTDRHDVRPCAASSLLRVTISVSNVSTSSSPLGARASPGSPARQSPSRPVAAAAAKLKLGRGPLTLTARALHCAHPPGTRPPADCRPPLPLCHWLAPQSPLIGSSSVYHM